MSFASIDLNLLRALHALLEEQTVTAAAERMGISQPSMSAALARLRRHFDDELLVRDGRRQRPTPLGLQLRERTRVALGASERVFQPGADFDPAASTREFRVLASDYEITMLGSRLAALLSAAAPGSQLQITTISVDSISTFPEALLDFDLLIIPQGIVTDVPHLELFRDEWMCIVSTNHPEVGDELTVDLMQSLPWVVCYHTPTLSAPVPRALHAAGVDLQVQVVLESFLAVADMVAGTRRVAFLPKRLVERLPANSGIRELPCPVVISLLTEAMWWHPFHDADPGHKFLRDLAMEATDSLRNPPRPHLHA